MDGAEAMRTERVPQQLSGAVPPTEFEPWFASTLAVPVVRFHGLAFEFERHRLSPSSGIHPRVQPCRTPAVSSSTGTGYPSRSSCSPRASRQEAPSDQDRFADAVTPVPSYPESEV